MRGALIVLLLAACGPKVTAPKPPAEPTGGGERLDRAAVANELRVAILDGYRLLAQGYENVYIDTLSRDDRLVIFDVGPGDVVVGDASKGAAVRPLFPGEEHEIVSKNLDVHLSADGTCAWTYDDLSTRVMRDGRRAIFPLRATSLYERREGRWQKVLEHVSYASTLEEAAARAAHIDAPFPDAAPPGEPGAKLRTLVASLIASAPRTPPVPDARAISFDAQVLEGPAVPTTVAAFFGPGATLEPVGLRVATSASGTVSWGAAVLSVHAGDAQFAARATWVLETRDGEPRVVQVHVSVPVPEAVLIEAAWGVTAAPN